MSIQILITQKVKRLIYLQLITILFYVVCQITYYFHENKLKYYFLHEYQVVCKRKSFTTIPTAHVNKKTIALLDHFVKNFVKYFFDFEIFGEIKEK